MSHLGKPTIISHDVVSDISLLGQQYTTPNPIRETSYAYFTYNLTGSLSRNENKTHHE